MEREQFTPDEFWNNVQSADWLRAFSLPLLPWAKPFLPILGLPKGLLENLEIWDSIYSKTIADFESQVQSRNWVSIRYEGWGDLVRQTVTDTLQQLQQQLGENVAIRFEQWVWFHIFCEEARTAMNKFPINSLS